MEAPPEGGNAKGGAGPRQKAKTNKSDSYF